MEKLNKAELIKEVVSKPELVSEVSTEKVQSALDHERRLAEIRAAEREDIIRMRKNWSKWILISIVAINVFDFFVVAGLGFGWISFPDGSVIPLFIGDTLIKTLGLAMIVVHFLFNREGKVK